MQCAMHGIVGKVYYALAFSSLLQTFLMAFSHWMSLSERDFRLAGNGESESSSSIFTAKLPSPWLPLSLSSSYFLLRRETPLLLHYLSPSANKTNGYKKKKISHSVPTLLLKLRAYPIPTTMMDMPLTGSLQGQRKCLEQHRQLFD